MNGRWIVCAADQQNDTKKNHNWRRQQNKNNKNRKWQTNVLVFRMEWDFGCRTHSSVTEYTATNNKTLCDGIFPLCMTRMNRSVCGNLQMRSHFYIFVWRCRIEEDLLESRCPPQWCLLHQRCAHYFFCLNGISNQPLAVCLKRVKSTHSDRSQSNDIISSHFQQ